MRAQILLSIRVPPKHSDTSTAGAVLLLHPKMEANPLMSHEYSLGRADRTSPDHAH